MIIAQSVVDCLACPYCHSRLRMSDTDLVCASCLRHFANLGDEGRLIIDLLLEKEQNRSDLNDWSNHWAEDKQDSFSQRFFSMYRKLVFSRTVAHYINRYFPESGVLVEAGSGTSETSIRIDKKDGGRILVAVDIILPILEENHAVMDVKIGGDIFHLPFLDGSLDGLWNVGVMEHFPHPQIDLMMGEFYRGPKTRSANLAIVACHILSASTDAAPG